MYSPKIDETLIPRLYRLGKKQRRPMTKLVNQAIAEFLARQEQSAQYPQSALPAKEIANVWSEPQFVRLAPVSPAARRAEGIAWRAVRDPAHTEPRSS